MAIRKKISGLFLAIILFFLLTFYIFMYFYFHNTVTAGGTGHGKPPSCL